MKRLIKSELHVLAGRIQQDLRSKAQKAQDACDKAADEINRTKAEMITIEIDTMLENMKTNLKGMQATTKKYLKNRTHRIGNHWDPLSAQKGMEILLRVPTVSEVLATMHTTQTEVTVPSITDIYHELVFQQIDAVDANELINRVVQKFGG